MRTIINIIIKLLLLLFAFFYFQNVSAAVVNWKNQKVNTTFKTIKTLELEYEMEGNSFILPRGTVFELFEVSKLNMIKVHLHKYKISNCPSPNKETDLQLIPVEQLNNSKTSVGVNLTRGCIIEVFIDMKEYNTMSFLE